MNSVFGGYDIRGIFGENFTLELAKDIGKAFGTVVKEKEVIVGYDTRSSSPDVFRKFSEGILSTGKNVVSVGMVPNPVAYFAGFKKNIPGAFITASHNPPEYNGIKFFRRDGTSFVDELNQIKKILESREFKIGIGKMVEDNNSINEYIHYLSEAINIKSNVKFVAECFNASASIIAPYVFEKCGIKCIPINNKIKGDFGGKRPEPKKDNLGELQKEVVRQNADFGIAFDGDSDRGVFVDEKGNVLNASSVGSLFIKDALTEKKGKIIVTYDCPSSISDFIKNLGGETYWSRIGHGFIEEALVREKAVFAYEQSSHFYFNGYYPFSDGFLSALKLSEILSKSKKTLSELCSEIKINPTEKFYIKLKDHRVKEKIISNIRKKFKGEDCIDGIKIKLGEKEWVMIRKSQTNPEINICAEAKTQERLNKISEEYTILVNDEIKKVKT